MIEFTKFQILDIHTIYYSVSFRVKLEVYETLVGMGFPTSAVKAAVRQTNNDLHRALEVLQERPDLLDIPDIEDDDWKGTITDEMIARVSMSLN